MEELDDPSRSSTTSNHLQDLDIEFSQIYFKAICDILDTTDQRNIRFFNRYSHLLRNKTNSFCEFYSDSYEENNQEFMNFLRDCLFYKITYVYKNSTILSSAVSFHFQNLLSENPKSLERLLKQRKIFICSLGSGPASDVVAIVKQLELAANASGVCLDIRVTLVDNDDSWQCTSAFVLRCLQSFRQATHKIKFIQADLSSFHTQDLINAVQNSDIVTAVKFCSEFGVGGHSFSKSIKDVTAIMKPESLFFFLDRSREDIIRAFCSPWTEITDLQLIYENICELHTLTIPTVEANYFMYHKYFGTNVSNTCLKVFVRAWTTPYSLQAIRELDPERRYGPKIAKYNAMTYFTEESIQFWIKGFSDAMQGEWKKTNIERYIEDHREMRQDLWLNFLKQTKYLESARYEMIHQNGKEVPYSSWKNYYNAKRDLTFVKRQIYCEEIINFRGYLKRKN